MSRVKVVRERARKVQEGARKYVKETGLYLLPWFAFLAVALYYFRPASRLYFWYFPIPEALSAQKYVFEFFLDGMSGMFVSFCMVFAWLAKAHSDASAAHQKTYNEVATTFIPKWSKISGYESFRRRLSALAGVVGDAIEGDPPEQEIIVESLLGGLHLRFKKHVEGFHNIGAVMEEEERSDLTRILIERSRSYILVLVQHGPIDVGAMRWNDGFRDSVSAEVKRKDFDENAILCVVAHDDDVVETQKTVDSIKKLGMKCYSVPINRIESALSPALESDFKNYGVLIEIFGRQIGEHIADSTKRTLPIGSTLAWKSTSFCKKEAHGEPTKLTKAEAIELIRGGGLQPDGVWLNRVVSKRVKASSEHVVGASEDCSLMERVLNTIVAQAKVV